MYVTLLIVYNPPGTLHNYSVYSVFNIILAQTVEHVLFSTEVQRLKHSLNNHHYLAQKHSENSNVQTLLLCFPHLFQHVVYTYILQAINWVSTKFYVNSENTQADSI